MNQRFAAIIALLAVALLLLLVRSFIMRVWSERFRGQRGHECHSGHGGVRYGIAHHDRGGRVHGGHSNVYYGGGSESWWPEWIYFPDWRAYWTV